MSNTAKKCRLWSIKSDLVLAACSRVSRNECLSLWSQRWLTMGRNWVSCFILLRFWHWKTLFESRLIDFKVVFVKEWKIEECLIVGSSLLHPVEVDRKKLKVSLRFIKGLITIIRGRYFHEII